jgi:hypothetical protein
MQRLNCEGRLRGERNGSRSGECGAEHREHGQVSVKLDAGKATGAERSEAKVMFQPSERPLDRSQGPGTDRRTACSHTGLVRACPSRGGRCWLKLDRQPHLPRFSGGSVNLLREGAQASTERSLLTAVSSAQPVATEGVKLRAHRDVLVRASAIRPASGWKVRIE